MLILYILINIYFINYLFIYKNIISSYKLYIKFITLLILYISKNIFNSTLEYNKNFILIIILIIKIYNNFALYLLLFFSILLLKQLPNIVLKIERNNISFNYNI